MSVGQIVQFLSQVRSGKEDPLAFGGGGKQKQKTLHPETIIRRLEKLLGEMSVGKEMVMNDFMTAAIVSGSMELCRYCLRFGYDIYIQGKRFCPIGGTEFYLRTPENKKTVKPCQLQGVMVGCTMCALVDWLIDQLNELDERTRKNFHRVEWQFIKKHPGCPCTLCNAESPEDITLEQEPPVALPFIGLVHRGDLNRLIPWLEGLQRQNGAVHKNHRQVHSEFLAACRGISSVSQPSLQLIAPV